MRGGASASIQGDRRESRPGDEAGTIYLHTGGLVRDAADATACISRTHQLPLRVALRLGAISGTPPPVASASGRGACVGFRRATRRPAARADFRAHRPLEPAGRGESGRQEKAAPCGSGLHFSVSQSSGVSRRWRAWPRSDAGPPTPSSPCPGSAWPRSPVPEPPQRRRSPAPSRCPPCRSSAATFQGC